MNNYQFIQEELKWLETIILTRLKMYFGQEVEFRNILDIVPPNTNKATGAYPKFIEKYALNFQERVCLILAFVPTLKPQLFDCLNIKNSNTGKRFVEFGCIEIDAIDTILPTFETLLFILSGDNPSDKINYTNEISNGLLFGDKIITLERINALAPLHFSALIPSINSIEMLINEKHYYPDFSASFPAMRLSTSCTWDDLVLNDLVMKQINEIKIWLKHGNKILDEWNLIKKIKPGYRVLFYGPSGTGKTFTAALLGKHTEKDVYRVDLSMIISKYIGETEKNLANIFDKAENKNWILFFDEADALFGKRTNINDSHDRYANQEISFLLQRIESYNGLVILSTNLKKNIDEAFTRRFQNIIHFPTPKKEERLILWEKTFSPDTKLDENINLDEISAKYDLTGGAIVNIVQYCSLMAMERGNNNITLSDLMSGIHKEYQKEGKTIL